MFNRVPAPFAGTIDEVIIEGGDSVIVQKSQTLFKVTPDDQAIERDPAEIIAGPSGARTATWRGSERRAQTPRRHARARRTGRLLSRHRVTALRWPDGGRERWRRAVALAGMLLGTSCAPVISTIHARACATTWWASPAARNAWRTTRDGTQSASRGRTRSRCAPKSSRPFSAPGTKRTTTRMDAGQVRMLSRGDGRDFILQSRLSVLRAEYDACRGVASVHGTQGAGRRGRRLRCSR